MSARGSSPAMEWLVRNAAHCGTTRRNVEAFRKQAQCFDKYSHPSRPGLASTWGKNLDNGFTLGAAFVPDYLPQYRKEMVNRLSLTRLIGGSITGTRRELLKQGQRINSQLGRSVTVTDRHRLLMNQWVASWVGDVRRR
jgi:hypothetical protein